MEEHSSGREPCPLPEHLRPRLAGDDQQLIHGDDLRFVASLDELEASVAALRALGVEHAQVLLTHRDGSPWIEIDAVPVPETEAGWPEHWGQAPHRLALWRYTLAVYVVGPDGAVPDDPIYRPNQEEP
jgi:hypothetical protein